MDIRPVLDGRLQKKYLGRPDTIIVHELGIHNGQNRVDIAVINGVLSGYEIKSERDTLQRLKHQVKAYDQVFDYMTLVVHEKHTADALLIVPDWWRIEEITQSKHALKFSVVKPGTINTDVNAYALTSLIWRDVALSILKKWGLDKGLRSARRETLWNALAEQLPLQDLQAEVRTAIRRQQAWLVEQERMKTHTLH